MIISCNLTKGQQAKLKKIVKSGSPDKIRLTKSQLEANSGQHFIKLNMDQTKQAMSALNRKKGMDLMLTKEQLVNMNREQAGGFFFLPFLVEAATAAAPYVASAVGSFVAEKAVSAIGNALFGGGQGGAGLAPYKKPQEGAGMKKGKKKTINLQIRKILFPIHTLSNFDILEYAKLVNLPIDCLAKNVVPKSIPDNTGIIVNLNNLGEKGSHWVCAIRKNNKCLYYDSFGVIHMPKEVEKCLLNSVGENNMYVSNGQNQYLVSIMCGYYCIKLCKSILLDGMDFKTAVEQFSDEPSMKNRDIADNLFI